MWTPEQLQNVTSLRTDEHNTWVTFFSTCLATTALLLIAIFNSGDLPTKNVGIIICSFGCFTSLIFFLVQNRALISMKTWERAIDQIEKERNLQSTKSFHQPAQVLGGRPIMTIVTFVQIIGWALGTFYFIQI